MYSISLKMVQLTWITVLIVGIVSSSHGQDDVGACLEANVIKCETEYRDKLSTAYDQRSYTDMCVATQELISCAEIDCGGDPWDQSDDYLTHLVNFMKDTGLCEGITGQASPKESRIAKKCLKKLAKNVKTTNDACAYYGEFSACILTRKTCVKGDTIERFREIMSDQLEENMPTKFGDTVIDMCPDWSTQYENIIS